MRPAADRLLFVLALVAAALAVAAALRSLVSRPPAGDAVSLEVRPVPLDPTDPSRTSVGGLLSLGGLWLRSADPRFGGLSDLRVSEDGERLLAVSDCGRGFTARLGYDAGGRLVALLDPHIALLSGPDGRPLTTEEVDAESLVREGGALEVGFEGRARILRYGLEPPFAGPARPLPMPAAVSGCGRNGGLETMSTLGDGYRLLICEGRRGPSATVPAWIGRGGQWTERAYPLVFEGGWGAEPFRPTGATLLPDGDVLVLERRFPPPGARVVRLSRASLTGEGPLQPREVARLEAPLTLDNYEGIDARRDASGRTLVYLLSDDNNCAKAGGASSSGLQRTLLLLFALQG